MKDYLISALDCAVPINSAIYISIPITSGETFLRWYTEEGKDLPSVAYQTSHLEHVMRPNIEKSLSYIQSIRNENVGKIVIEPTSLVVPSWTQIEYLDFWIQVIRKYIYKGYFVPGWNLSRGCAFEFLACIEKGVETYDINGRRILLREGISLIKSTIIEYRKLGLEVESFVEILMRLENLNQ